MITNTSLRLLTNAGTAAVTGDWNYVGGNNGSFAFQVVTGGTVSGGTVTFEGSTNGIDADTTALATWIAGTDATKVAKFATGKPFQYIRAKTGGMVGTGPLVQAWANVGQ